jgi:hypothetical protein
VNLCEEVQNMCCFSYLKSVFKISYVGSDSFTLQNGSSHWQLVIGWKWRLVERKTKVKLAYLLSTFKIVSLMLLIFSIVFMCWSVYFESF